MLQQALLETRIDQAGEVGMDEDDLESRLNISWLLLMESLGWPPTAARLPAVDKVIGKLDIYRTILD